LYGTTLSFHGAHRPHCVALRADVKNPLLKALTPPGDHSSDSEGDGDDDGSDSDDADSYADGSDSNDEDKCPPIVIEWEGLRDRVVALPVSPGRYGHVRGLDDGRFMFVKYPIRRGGRVGLDAPYYGDDGGSDAENERADDSDDEDAGGVGALCKFDVRRLKTSVLIPSGVRSVVLSMDRRCMLVEKSVDGYVELRAHKAGTKPDEEDSDGEDVDEDAFDRRSGLIDIDGRIAAEVDPLAEWTQALLETWRICRDEWFDAGMAHGDARGVADWEGALTRHARLLPRVASVAELSDVLREMTAELRSSHVHVSLGDAGSTARRRSPAPGRLGCDLVWDAKMRGYRITHIVGGDQWDDLTGGALRKPGLNVAVGDAIVALNRVTLTEEVGVDEVLTGKGGAEVMVTFKVGDRGGGGGGGGGRSTGEIAPAAAASDKKNRSGGSGAKHKKTKGKDATAADAAGANGTLKRGDVVSVRVRAMHSELDARYRDAVRDRTSRVAKLGKDQVGYLHLPDMERTGYSEFWRHFPREVKKGALIVDLRGNAGGHISELLLAKLAQRPLAWDVPRRGAAATARSIHTGSHTTPLAS
jgi:tricorn protease